MLFEQDPSGAGPSAAAERALPVLGRGPHPAAPRRRSSASTTGRSSGTCSAIPRPMSGGWRPRACSTRSARQRTTDERRRAPLRGGRRHRHPDPQPARQAERLHPGHDRPLGVGAGGSPARSGRQRGRGHRKPAGRSAPAATSAAWRRPADAARAQGAPLGEHPPRAEDAGDRGQARHRHGERAGRRGGDGHGAHVRPPRRVRRRALLDGLRQRRPRPRRRTPSSCRAWSARRGRSSCSGRATSSRRPRRSGSGSSTAWSRPTGWPRRRTRWPGGSPPARRSPSG